MSEVADKLDIQDVHPVEPAAEPIEKEPVTPAPEPEPIKEVPTTAPTEKVSALNTKHICEKIPSIPLSLA